MAKRYRLLARAEVDGAVRDPGYIFALPLNAEGQEMLGPHRTVEHGADKIDLTPGSDGNRIPGRVRDVPLYEEVLEGDEIAPTVERSPDVRGAEMAMAGGSRVVEDEREAAAERHERLKHLDERGEDVTDDERKERDELRARKGEAHVGEYDAQHAGGHVHDHDWQGEKPPISERQGNPAHHEVPVGEPDDTAKFDETFANSARHEHEGPEVSHYATDLPAPKVGEAKEPPHGDDRQRQNHEIGERDKGIYDPKGKRPESD